MTARHTRFVVSARDSVKVEETGSTPARKEDPETNESRLLFLSGKLLDLSG